MKKKIIITAGPTIEKIDAVMEITNMSTGALGCTVAETILRKWRPPKIPCKRQTPTV